ncbi:hypothetical protein ILUMI_25985 [Ignelater luminosus]|uniref:Glycosyl transferase CAP10 domain-containing protein n=1 Tax=Ignelater luminosus TaxID=2038154 RepID=A0A8K0FZJ0_IGNLU|nr:hypothetical protein ILUMI_25985 [Ignelater luminosus]
MPARYLFVESVNENDSCSKTDLHVEIKGTTRYNKPCRIWTDVLHIRRCSFIIRYKVYETCGNFIVSLKYKDDHIANSPYTIDNEVYPDDCNCALKNINMWLKEWECGDVPEQISNDLKRFNNINFKAIRQKIITKYDSPGSISLCHYIIKENKIYRTCYGKYVGFKMFMDSILLSLTKKTIIPNLEFFVNLGDWPLVKDANDNFPIFSWCGSIDSYDIVMPTYDITESALENMGRVMLDMLSVQGNVKKNWNEKIPKVFWRGRDSNRERLHLIDISHEHPNLFNVSLTNFFFFRSEEEKYGPKAEHVSFFNFFDYKYQLSIDGTVAAYRLPYLLAGGSLLLKQESKYYEHFYNNMIPNIHYIPVKRNLSDLIEKVNWAVNNDAKAEQIAKSGQDFATKNLLPKDIFCYHGHLLNEFSKKIVSKTEILDNMEIVEGSKVSNCKCNQKVREEL